MNRRSVLVAILAFSGGLWAGCQKPVHFPAEPIASLTGEKGAPAAYDADHDGQADFFTFANAMGRIDRVGYDSDGDRKPDRTINLDAIPPGSCRHLVIILDGHGYDVVKRYYDEGHLRLFHPPSRVVAPYPTLTDLAMEDIFGYVPCPAFEAEYFDSREGRLAGGSWDYLAGKNQPYNRLLQYRSNLIYDAIGYVYPWAVFGKEVNDAKRLFDKSETQELLAYFVSSAGVSTKMGAEGQKMCLALIERFVNQVVRETGGLVKVTLLSDHGHSYTPARRIELQRYLQDKGWRVRKKLAEDSDVVYVRFGLETYASFGTRRPGKLAADLVGCEGVDLASYADGETVVLLGSDGGRAVIRQDTGRFRYETPAGDSLKLKAILDGLQPDEKGFFDADELLSATIAHEYPAPLQRLWRAHFALAENTPDVIISLKNEFFSGSKSLAGSVKVASTHGSLNYSNSVTFIMSTAGPLPPVMRSADIPANMQKLLGAPWPMRK